MMAFFIFHASSSPLAYEQRADGVVAKLQLTEKKNKLYIAKHERQTSENTLAETNSRDSLCFSFVWVFFFFSLLR